MIGRTAKCGCTLDPPRSSGVTLQLPFSLRWTPGFGVEPRARIGANRIVT